MKHTVLAALFATAIAVPAAAEDAVCYNCPPQWADWASMLEAINENLGIRMPHDNKNSGQTLSQLLAERASPVADCQSRSKMGQRPGAIVPSCSVQPAPCRVCSPGS